MKARHSSGSIKRQRSDDILHCSALQQRPLNCLDSNTVASMANKPRGPQAFQDSNSAFCDRGSVDDISLAEEAASINPPDAVARSTPPKVCTEQSPFVNTGLTYPQATNTRFQAGPTFGSNELDLDISMLMQPVQTFGNSDASLLMQPAQTFPELDISMMMQPARSSGELDIPMQMRHAQIFAAMPTQIMQQQTRQYDNLDISMLMRPADSYSISTGGSVSMEPQVNASTR